MAPLTKVLIADDDRVIVEMLTAVLRAKRVKVTAAADAMQAVMFAIREAPDAIVLDIGMPGGTGLTALRKLHDNRKTAFIPVLVLTGATDPTLPATVADLGAVFVRKPLRPAELYPILVDIVDRRAALAEQVFESVRNSSIEEIITELEGQGVTTTEVELSVVLDHLAMTRRVLRKDERWYVA